MDWIAVAWALGAGVIFWFLLAYWEKWFLKRAEDRVGRMIREAVGNPQPPRKSSTVFLGDRMFALSRDS